MEKSEIQEKVDKFISCLAAGKPKSKKSPEPDAPCIYASFKKCLTDTPEDQMGQGKVKEFLAEILETIPLCKE